MRVSDEAERSIIQLMIIGVCGNFASGKDAVANYLESHGFTHISTGDLVREYVTANNLGGLDRDNLLKVANQIRSQKGSGYLVCEALKRGHRNLVISGVRSTGEAQAVHDAKGVIVGVDAPIQIRYDRLKARGRIDDAVSIEDFARQEAAEQSHKQSESNITAVLAMTDFQIANDSTEVDLHRRIDDILKQLTHPV